MHRSYLFPKETWYNDPEQPTGTNNLKLFAMFFRLAGYRGMLIFIDEFADFIL